MKHLIIRLLVGVVTFSIGFSTELISTATHSATDAPQTEAVSTVPENLSQTPVADGISSLTSNFILDYNPKEFNPRGVYYIIGRKPKEFREFDSFGLAAYEFYDQAEGDVTIQTYDNQMYNAAYTVSGNVTKEKLTFVAAPLSEDGFEYSFDGYFLKKGVLSNSGKSKAVLKGKLSKLKSGVKVAESEIKFRIEYLGC